MISALIFMPVVLAGGELPRIINFILFVAVLVFLLRKPAAQFFKNRAAQIGRELEQAESEREAARSQLHRVESRLSRLDEEIEQMRAQARTEAQAEAVRIESATQSDIAKLEALAQREVEAALTAAHIELKTFAATEATGLAESLLRHELTDQDHHRLIERFGEQIEEARR